MKVKQSQQGQVTALELIEAATLTPHEVLSRLTSRSEGLSGPEVDQRVREFGANVLAVHRVRASVVLWRQLKNPILILLLGAALVSGFTGGGTNAIIIAVIVLLSVGLGFVNEFRAAVAMSTLRSKISQNATVHRDGTVTQIPVTELVPGDIITLNLGTLVPADVRLLSVDELECDEAVLTGESMPVPKSEIAVTEPDASSLSDCAYMGTIVHQGSALAVVVQTGTRTAFGRFAVNIILSRPLIEALLFSLAIAVGIAPEMMPAIVTVSLSSGSRALAAKKVLVKRLVAIEDLGNIELLFTDKTGTLTEGVITFERALDVHGADAERPLLLGLLCNESTMSEHGPVGGNSLDQALWVAAAARGDDDLDHESAAFERIAALPFDHERQMGSVLIRGSDGVLTLVIKGAPEVVLERCVNVADSIRTVLDALFADGERVIAVASRDRGAVMTVGTDDEVGLTLEGFLTFADKPKSDAGASLAKLQQLGVEVKIITGDNGQVAAKVCRDIGLACAGVVSGTDLEAMSDDQLEEAIPTTTVFARIGPDQKSRIIEVARRTGRDVAFLGDGVNDAVALHHADVGISVDSGADVAKDAADVVLLDKDLGVLAVGVMEGRRIFANTMKFVLMATSSNFGNMFSAAGASAFLSFLPMLPSQILLNNLLYNMGQLAIPTDRVDVEALARPAAWDLRYIRRFMSVFGPISSIFDFVTFYVMLSLLHAGHVEFRTGWFVESIATQTLVVYVIRTRRVPFFKSRPSKVMILVPTGAALVGALLPYTGLAHLFGFSVLPTKFFLLLFGMVVVYLVLVEVAKLWFFQSQSPRLAVTATTHSQRLNRRIMKRASRFVRHEGPSLR